MIFNIFFYIYYKILIYFKEKKKKKINFLTIKTSKMKP